MSKPEKGSRLALVMAERDRLRSRNEELEAALATAIGVANELHSIVHAKPRDAAYNSQADVAHGRLKHKCYPVHDATYPPDSEPYKCRCPRCGDSFTAYEPHTPIQWKCPKCNVPLTCESGSIPPARNPGNLASIAADRRREETDSEPAEGASDPRKDCPWKCSPDDRHCLCLANAKLSRQDAMLERREALEALERLIDTNIREWGKQDKANESYIPEGDKKDIETVRQAIFRTSDEGGVAEWLIQTLRMIRDVEPERGDRLPQSIASEALDRAIEQSEHGEQRMVPVYAVPEDVEAHNETCFTLHDHPPFGADFLTLFRAAAPPDSESAEGDTR